MLRRRLRIGFMLQPSRTKFRKQQRGKMRGMANEALLFHLVIMLSKLKNHLG